MATQFKFKDGRLFTGALDKNGNEIYDDDRVTVNSDWHGLKDEKGTVKYIPERALFAVFFDKPDAGGASVGADGKDYNWHGFDDLDDITVLTEAAA
jgi:hypothetical protein